MSAAAGAALIVSLAFSAAAGAACPTAPTSQPFERFGDDAEYSPVSNGDFESDASDWSLTRAAVVSGNESHYVRDAADTKSLSIEPGGSAVSPAFCVGAEHPTFRFFARRTSGIWGVLGLKLRWTTANGNTNETLVGALSGTPFSDPFASWRPTDALMLARALPLWSDQTVSVRLVLSSSAGGWAVDDVYIDPYRR